MQAKDEPHRTKEQMKDDIQKFLRSLRTECKKAGTELKYVHVMEIGEKGARHHHLIINNIDIKVLTKLWKFGRPHIHPLDDSGQYEIGTIEDVESYLCSFLDED